MKNSYQIVLPYSIVILLAYIGFSLPLPLLPEMFLDATRSVVAPKMELKNKMILLGLVMASFPLGQFLGSPLLGHLSDRFGRKRVIIFSLLGATIGYFLTALSVLAPSVRLMIFSLALCGFCEGNVTIAQSVIADLTSSEDQHAQKAIHFGRINLFISLGFIIGPLMGAYLADPEVASWFNFSTPFWVAGLLTLLGVGVIYRFSQETLIQEEDKNWSFFRAVGSGFACPNLRIYYGVNFFLAFGYFSFFRFFPVFLERVFDFSASDLGYVMVYNSVLIGLGVMILVPFLSKRFKPVRLLTVFSACLAVAFVGCLLPNTPYALIATMLPIGLCLSVVITYGSLLISNRASQALQGQVLGTLTSVQVLAGFLTAALGGFLAAEHIAWPLYLGAASTLLGGCVLLKEWNE